MALFQSFSGIMSQFVQDISITSQTATNFLQRASGQFSQQCGALFVSQLFVDDLLHGFHQLSLVHPIANLTRPLFGGFRTARHGGIRYSRSALDGNSLIRRPCHHDSYSILSLSFAVPAIGCCRFPRAALRAQASRNQARPIRHSCRRTPATARVVRPAPGRRPERSGPVAGRRIRQHCTSG